MSFAPARPGWPVKAFSGWSKHELNRYSDKSVCSAYNVSSRCLVLGESAEYGNCVLSKEVQSGKRAHYGETLETLWGNNRNSDRLYFGGAPKSLQMVTAVMKLKDSYSLEGKL